ncbi:MAG: S24/S26 family peptidase [Clostridia bacterium]|nr:S24/S26 family peptidase [Clostridia bacterium]
MTSLNKHTVHAEEMMPLILEALSAGQSVCGLTFQGVSMRPMLREGKDTVELSRLPERLRKYDLPVYAGPNGKYVMHRIVAVHDDHYICLGDNTYHYEKIKPEQMVAVVSAFKRGEKRISTNDPAYQLYCRVWCGTYPLRKLLKRIEGKLRGCLRRLFK